MTPEGPKCHRKSRSGCLTCKGRKKKCDEVKPRCAGCRRNQLVCEWPTWVLRRAGFDIDNNSESSVSTTHSPSIPDNGTPTLMIPPPVPVLHAGSKRASVLTPESVVLLGHYFAETAASLAMTPLNENPFVTVLLPLGQADDLLMHGLLALSGAHLSFREPCNTKVTKAAGMHHSLLVSQLRAEVSGLRENDVEKHERLLRILLVLCQYEAVSGDAFGNIFNHLRACHHFIVALTSLADAGCRLDKDTWNLSKEWFAYLVSCNTITPHGLVKGRTLPIDAFETAINDLEGTSRSGAFLAGCHELYQMAPKISVLAAHRLAEEDAGLDRPSEALRAIYDHSRERLTTWRMPATGTTSMDSSEDSKLLQHAAEALRQAMHLYLEAGIAGSMLREKTDRATISQHVRAVFSESQHLIASRQYLASICWPLMIAASCLATPSWQEVMLSEMCSGWFQMRQLQVWKELLEFLYRDPDPRAFGPYGLYLMMEKHGLNVANG